MTQLEVIAALGSTFTDRPFTFGRPMQPIFDFGQHLIIGNKCRNPYKTKVGTPGKAVCKGVGRTWHIIDFQIELRQILLPSDMAWGQVGLLHEMLQRTMISATCNGEVGSTHVVLLDTQGKNHGNQLAFMN